MDKTIGEIKFAVSDVLMDVYGLQAQSIVEKVENAKTYDEIKNLVFNLMKRPEVAKRLDVVNRLRAALS